MTLALIIAFNEFIAFDKVFKVYKVLSGWNSERRYFSRNSEFAVSVVWLGIAFGIAIAGGIEAFKDSVGLRTTIFESLVVVFFAFVFHELAHRIAARRYGFKAVYHVWIPGLILAMGGALFGFLFAAPGGVHIQIGQNTAENRAKLGKSALAGPIVNMVLAVVFAVFTFAFIYFVDSYLSSTGKSLSQLASWVNHGLWNMCHRSGN